VLATLKPDAFQACFARWVQSLREAALDASDEEQSVLAVDGKTLRRSHDRQNGLGPLHLVSVWASEMGLTLGQVATDEKSNEITAIPEVLRLVDLSGAIITIDAMGTQTAIAAQVVDGGGDFVLTVKGKYRTLFESLRDYVDEQMETDFAGIGARRHVTKETGHGRDETRIYIQVLPEFAR
ncbi:MAG TPA: ISAs1 family transposase, partial [Guyparkeria sp.]|nr:ISAs1 family transposase [Guyparkeria sp.]